MTYKEILAKVRESKQMLAKKKVLYNNYKEKIDYLKSLKLSFKSNGINYQNESEQLAQESFLIGDYSKAMHHVEVAVAEAEHDYTDSEKIKELISNLSLSFSSLEDAFSKEFEESLANVSKKLADGKISSARFDVDILSQSFDEHINIVDSSKTVLDQLDSLLESSKDFILVDEFMDDLYQCQKLLNQRNISIVRKNHRV